MSILCRSLHNLMQVLNAEETQQQLQKDSEYKASKERDAAGMLSASAASSLIERLVRSDPSLCTMQLCSQHASDRVTSFK